MAKDRASRRIDLSSPIDPPGLDVHSIVTEVAPGGAESPATPRPPQEPPVPREVVARAVHLLCRAGSSLAPHHLLRGRLERLVGALVDRPELARMVVAPLALIADALALDPHLEASARDVRAAVEAMGSVVGP